MSFNPVLARTPDPNNRGNELMPFCPGREQLLLIREKTALAVKINGKSYSGSGIAFLTSKRLVFLKEGDVAKHKNWSSCEFPFRCIHNKGLNKDQPEFQQPVFGANRLVFWCRPSDIADYKFDGDAQATLTFKDACQTFVRLFLILMRAAALRGGDATSETSSILQNLQAFHDQRDPSRIFFAQPVQQQMGAGYPLGHGYAPGHIPPQANNYYPPPPPPQGYHPNQQYPPPPPPQYAQGPPQQYTMPPPQYNQQPHPAQGMYGGPPQQVPQYPPGAPQHPPPNNHPQQYTFSHPGPR